MRGDFMKPVLIRLFLSCIVLVCINCSKKSDNSDSDADLGTPVIDAAKLYGMWVFESVTLQDNKDQAIVVSGENKRIYRADGSYFSEIQAQTLSVSGNTQMDSCTRYNSSKFSVSNGSATMTDIISAYVEGVCSRDDESPTVIDSPDEAGIKLYINGDKLNQSTEFTYKDKSGNSKKDQIVMTFKKTAEETWDGTGIDPRFDGSWTVTKMYLRSKCLVGEDAAEIAISGTQIMSVNGSEIEIENKNFALDTAEKCTGTIKASLSVTNLNAEIEYDESTASNNCIKPSPEKPGYAELIDKDILTPSNKWISVKSFKYTDEDCGDDVRQVKSLMIAEKS